jgi:hypothetical protein
LTPPPSKDELDASRHDENADQAQDGDDPTEYFEHDVSSLCRENGLVSGSFQRRGFALACALTA